VQTDEGEKEEKKTKIFQHKNSRQKSKKLKFKSEPTTKLSLLFHRIIIFARAETERFFV